MSAMLEIAIGGIIVLVFALLTVAASVYVVNQWEKAAILRLGRIVKVVGAGMHLRIPFIDSVRRVDFRMRTLDLRGQAAITKDNISVGIDAVVFINVEDAAKLITSVVDYEEAVSKYSQTSMRDIVGQYTLDDLLASREKVAASLKDIVDELTAKWGVNVEKAELQEIALPTDMKRAFAVQAESERESRAIKIKSQAELEASKTYREASENLKDPMAMQLRILETIKEVSKDQSNTILFALPTETIQSIGIEGLAALGSIRPKYLQGTLQQNNQTD